MRAGLKSVASNTLKLFVNGCAVIRNLVVALYETVVRLALRPIPYSWGAAVFQAFLILIVVYWWKLIPPSGYAVAALAFAAAIMAVRGTRFTRWEEVAWIAITFMLFLIEIRAIGRDRQMYAEQQRQERGEFQNIAGGLTSIIQQSQLTMHQLNRTMQNTMPKAIIDFRSITPLTPPLVANREEDFNIEVVNVGNDTARDLSFDARIYVETLDNTEEQSKAARDFDRWWIKNLRSHRGDKGGILVPGAVPVLFTIKRVFTDDEIKQTEALKKTFYYLLRVAYSDEGGRWIYDFCAGKQNPYFPNVNHACTAHNNDRYPAPKNY